MKKADFIRLSLAFAVLLLLFACRKDIDFVIQGKEKPSSAHLELAKVWHLQRLDKTKSASDQLAPRWDDSWNEQTVNGNDILVVPARENPVNNRDVKIRRFFIFTTIGQSISDGRIVEFVGLKYDVGENLRFLLKNHDRSAISGFSGAIIQYDVNYVQIGNAFYKDGQRISSETAIVTQSGKVLQERSRQNLPKTMSLNAMSGGCAPVGFEMIGFPEPIPGCFYNITEVRVYDNDTGCLIEHLFIYNSHYCVGEESGTASGTGGGSGTSGEGAPEYGGGDHGGGEPAVLVMVIGPVTSIDLESRLACFNQVPSNSSTVYKMTISSELASKNVPTAVIGPKNSVGHAFLTLEKTNGTNVQRLSFGFYPEADFLLTKQPVDNSIGEESSNIDRRSDISYSVTLNEASFLDVAEQAITSSENKYDLNDYNCTDYAIEVFNSGRPSNEQLVVPNSANPYAPYTTPSGLYLKLNSMKAAGTTGISNISVPPPASTSCD